MLTAVFDDERHEARYTSKIRYCSLLQLGRFKKHHLKCGRGRQRRRRATR